MSSSDGSAAFIASYDAQFQISPIILTGGLAVGQPGNSMPITNLYGQQTSTTNTGDVFARFIPLPGSTLINQVIASFPFANQQVAANATIQQPLTLSLLMIAPVNTAGGYFTKQAFMLSFQKSLYLHNTSGGLYNVNTPAYLYQNMVMTGMTDITHDDGKQKQIEWQMDFIQPLITLADAVAAQGSLFQKVTNGSKILSTNYNGQ